VSGGTDAALIGRWHLSQGCERDLERPLPLQRGSVSAGIHSESVSSKGSSVDPYNGTNLINGVHTVSGGTDAALIGRGTCPRGVRGI